MYPTLPPGYVPHPTLGVQRVVYPWVYNGWCIPGCTTVGMPRVYHGGYAGCTMVGMQAVPWWVYLGFPMVGVPRVFPMVGVPRGVPWWVS